VGTVIGEVLPLALGILISPIPIIATILMLLAPQARAASVGFMLGWLAGIVVALVVFVLLSGLIPEQNADASRPVSGVVKIVLGVLMLLIASRQWRGRPHEGEEPRLPGWMTAIDKMTSAKAIGLGFALAAVNPKNLLMAAGAGVLVGTADLSTGEVALVVAVFTVIAGASVLVPVVGYLVARDKMSGPLQSLRVWLVHNNATVMAVLLLVIGVTMIGKGIGSF
jgi:threonine/homoserine/homoserine lactone efflux protein